MKKRLSAGDEGPGPRAAVDSGQWTVDRVTDTEAVLFSVSLLLLLARSATHAEGVTLF